MKPIFEFLLWDNCSNKCKFCFLCSKPRLFSLQLQAEVLSLTESYLKSNAFEAGSHALFVGGELFDDILRESMLGKLFREVACMQESDRIDLTYLNTNLLYSSECLGMLKRLLNIFACKGLFSQLKFATSYDLEGRFKTESSRQLFFSNMHSLKMTYPELNIVTNVILTKQVCEAVLNGSFSVKKFMEENSTYVNMIPYIILDEDLSPTRKLVFDAILKTYDEDQAYAVQWLKNTCLKQPRKLLYMKDGKFMNCECALSDCGHSENFKRYSSHNTCFVCDLQIRFNTWL